jgi:hypothetical protein
MRAKMLDAIPDVGVYVCQNCQSKFKFFAGEMVCFRCDAKGRENFDTIYVEDDYDQEQFYNSIDWLAGD